MPDSIRTCGELKAPPQRMTSRVGVGVQRLAALLDIRRRWRGCAASMTRATWARDFDREILPLHRRMQIADRGRAALAVADRILAAAEALARAAVVVVGDRQAGHARGLEPGGEHRVLGLGPLHADVAVVAAILALAVLPALDALEVGQHVGIGPAARALLRPAVVVGRVAAGEGHDVDRGRAAQHLAAHLLDAAAVEVRVGLGLIAPVVHLVFVQLAEPDRDVDQRIEVAAAGFEQQHARVRVLRQAVGQHAAGGAAADDDVVVAVVCHVVTYCLRSGIWISSSSCALVSGAGMYLNVTASAMTSSTPEIRSGSTAALGRNSASARLAVASEMLAHLRIGAQAPPASNRPSPAPRGRRA